MHRRLAALYEPDPGFAANVDKYGVALTPFLAAAVRENAKTGGEWASQIRLRGRVVLSMLRTNRGVPSCRSKR